MIPTVFVEQLKLQSIIYSNVRDLVQYWNDYPNIKKLHVKFK